MRAKLMPTPAQEQALLSHAGQARAVYNAAVEQHSHYGHAGRGSAPGFAEQSRQLTEARAEVDWLREGSRVVQAQALRDFWRGMQGFFDGRVRRPVRRRKWENTFNVTGRGCLRVTGRRGGAVKIPKIGWVRLRLPKSHPAREAALESASFRVVQEPTGWFVAFVTDYRGAELEVQEERTEIGVDLGVTTTVVLSTGQHYRSPFRPRAESRIEALQRKKDAAPHRSEERRRLARRIAEAKAREARRRADWREKMTTRLVQEHSLIAVEDLRPADMMRRPRKKRAEDGTHLPNGAAAKAGLNRGLARSGFGAFRARLELKAARAKSPTSVVRVPARGTSQTCSRCGYRDAENRRTQAEFLCLSCGFEYHADSNAARVILARGLALAPAGGQSVPALEALGSTTRSAA